MMLMMMTMRMLIMTIMKSTPHPEAPRSRSDLATPSSSRAAARQKPCATTKALGQTQALLSSSLRLLVQNARSYQQSIRSLEPV